MKAKSSVTVTRLALFCAVFLFAAIPVMSGCGDDGPVDQDVSINEDAAGDDVIEESSQDTADDTTGDRLEDTIDDASEDNVEDLPGDSSGSELPPDAVECLPEPAGPVIRVNVYNDTNASSKTDLAQSRTDVDTPVAGVPVVMLAPNEDAGVTCEEGYHYFAPESDTTFTDGVRVVRIDAPPCRVTSHNVARRTPIALADGRWKMLVMGDSIPRMGSTEGNYFFDYVAEYLQDFGDIEIENVAFAGTESAHWLPDLANFQTKVLPKLSETDVVFISLGGNDIMHSMSDAPQGATLLDLLNIVEEAITTVETNLTAIFDAIREQNPDVDIVWLIYPNYAESDLWMQSTGSYAEMVANFFEEKLIGIMSWASGIDGLLLVDLFSRLSKDELDASLADELHYNAGGHRILADELFKILGGVLISGGEPTIGGERFIGINCDK
ncbi:MAG TPA: SGNH/GDSL hydrolase family protein [Myxococcota bacterium]|nr:SGNH/GDSL hydrolase family protein [Myxococcota bacterium]